MIARYLNEDNEVEFKLISNEEISDEILNQVGIREKLKDIKKIFLTKEDTFSTKPIYSLKLVDHSWGVHFKGKEFIILAYSWASNYTYHDEISIFRNVQGKYHFYDVIRVSAVHSWKTGVRQSSELTKEIAYNLSKVADFTSEVMDEKISEARDGTLGHYILNVE